MNEIERNTLALVSDCVRMISSIGQAQIEMTKILAEYLPNLRQAEKDRLLQHQGFSMSELRKTQQKAETLKDSLKS